MEIKLLEMPAQPMECMVGTLQDLEQHTRIAHVTLKSFMHNDPPIPFKGILQVNGSGPTVWVSVSEPLIEMIRGVGHGIKIEALLSRDKGSLVELIFFDDTEIMEGDLTKTEITIEDVYISMQKYINIWEGGIKSTR